MKKVKNPLSPAQLEVFHKYVLKWQKKLNLSDWRVEYVSKPTTAMASVTLSHPDRLAVYKVGNFGTEPVTDQIIEATVVHELIHVLLAELVNQVDYGIKDSALTSAEHRVVNTLEKLLMEYA